MDKEENKVLGGRCFEKSNSGKIISIKNKPIKQSKSPNNSVLKTRIDVASKNLKEGSKTDILNGNINKTMLTGIPLNKGKKVLVKKGATYTKKDIGDRW